MTPSHTTALVSGPGTQASAVSWAAIFAGAAAAAALSLVLLMLGTGLGLSSLSPWADEGASAKTLGASTILWVTFMQLAASAMGGYVAGRLRTRWADLHSDEVTFRDTAHGFLAWGIATLLTATLLTSAITTIVGGGIQAGASVAGGAASAAAAGGAAAAGSEKDNAGGGPMSYFTDSLFRREAKAPARGANAAAAADKDAPAEAGRIFINALKSGKMPAEDSRYLGQVVAQRTGLSQQDAEKRVNETFAKLQEAEVAAKEAADKARKASALAALWLTISLLMGAFVAGWFATYGGRRRDAPD